MWWPGMELLKEISLKFELPWKVLVKWILGSTQQSPWNWYQSYMNQKQIVCDDI